MSRAILLIAATMLLLTATLQLAPYEGQVSCAPFTWLLGETCK